MNMTAATTNTRAPRPGTSVTRPLLAIHFLRRSSDLGTRLRLMTTLTLIRLIHHHRIMQQLLADANRQIRRGNFVVTNLSAGAIVNR